MKYTNLLILGLLADALNDALECAILEAQVMQPEVKPSSEHEDFLDEFEEDYDEELVELLDEIEDDDFDDFDDDFDDEDEDDLWDNPPPPAASWPKVAKPASPKPKVDLWNYPPAKVGTWPNVTKPAVATPVASSWPKVAKPTVATVVAKTKVDKPAVSSVSGIRRETVGRDARGRACASKALTAHVGMKPHQSVYVAHRAGGNGLVLLKRTSKTGHLSTYFVDKDGNIRLSEYILKRGGLGGSQKIKFRTSDSHDSIIVMAG